MKPNDTYELIRHWEVIDEAVYPDGRRELLRPIDCNLVVNNCSVLLASLIKAHATGLTSSLWWAVGTGNGWNDALLPSPSVTTTTLTNEVYRKVIPAGNISFLTTENVVTGTPTNKIQITLTFSESEANYSLMEFAIFGGPNVSSAANSGLMINHKIHNTIAKTSSFTLARTIRLTF